MEQKRKFKGIWIPREIWESPQLNAAEKVLLAEIDSLDNENGCTASNLYFAGFFHIGERQIKRYVESLQDQGWIKSTRIGRNRRSISVTEKFANLRDSYDSTEGHKRPSTEGHKRPAINTEINNTDSSSSAETAEGRKTWEEKRAAGEEVDEITYCMDLFRYVNPAWGRLFARKPQRESLTRLLKKIPAEQLEKIIRWLPKVNGQPYAPTITTPQQLEEKLGALKAYLDKQKHKGQNGGVISV